MQNPVTVLRLTEDAAGSSKSPPESLDRRGCTAATPPAKPRPTRATMRWTSQIGALGHEEDDESFAATGILTHSDFII